jgi:hypothetical protein
LRPNNRTLEWRLASRHIRIGANDSSNPIELTALFLGSRLDDDERFGL